MITQCSCCGRIKRFDRWVKITPEQLDPTKTISIRSIICEDCRQQEDLCEGLKNINLRFYVWCAMFAIFTVITAISFIFIFGFWGI